MQIRNGTKNSAKHQGARPKQRCFGCSGDLPKEIRNAPCGYNTAEQRNVFGNTSFCARIQNINRQTAAGDGVDERGGGEIGEVHVSQYITLLPIMITRAILPVRSLVILLLGSHELFLVSYAR